MSGVVVDVRPRSILAYFFVFDNHEIEPRDRPFVHIAEDVQRLKEQRT